MAACDWQVRIPHSDVTVGVSVIDTTTYFYNTPGSVLVEPIYPGYEFLTYPSYSFLIHHEPSDSRVLFDLGVRANYLTTYNPKLLEEVKPMNLTIEIQKDVADILHDDGVSLQSINHIIFSHHHWDHTGDTTKFPGSTSLIVGPGYKEKYLPGWPVDPESTATTSDLYEGRETVELDFATGDPKTTTIGEYRAYDWFGDGSFYLLDTAGHTVGHLCALARTTPSTFGAPTFIFMGGDIAHHGALFRPTQFAPLPKTICPAPYDPPMNYSCCAGELYASIHRVRNETDGRGKPHTTPFCIIPSGWVQQTPEAAEETLKKMHVFDADPNIFTIVAHDLTLREIIDYYPKQANDWKAKGWSERSHWRFLQNLRVEKDV